MLSVTHQWTIHHALTINPHDASLFDIQPEQGNAITQKIQWVVLAKAVLRAGTLTDPCRLRESVLSLYLVAYSETYFRRVLISLHAQVTRPWTD